MRCYGMLRENGPMPCADGSARQMNEHTPPSGVCGYGPATDAPVAGAAVGWLLSVSDQLAARGHNVARRLREMTMFLLRPILSWPVTPMGTIWIFLPAARKASISCAMVLRISMLLRGSFLWGRLKAVLLNHGQSWLDQAASSIGRTDGVNYWERWALLMALRCAAQ